MYRCSVRSTLTYACKTWPFTEKQERRLLVSDRRLIRKTVRVRWFIVTKTTNAYRTAKNWSYWISWDLHQKNGRVMFIDSKRHLRQELSWNKTKILDPKVFRPADFRIYLNLIATEWTISSKTLNLKLWKRTEHVGVSSLEQPQEIGNVYLCRISPSELTMYK